MRLMLTVADLKMLPARVPTGIIFHCSRSSSTAALAAFGAIQRNCPQSRERLSKNETLWPLAV